MPSVSRWLTPTRTHLTLPLLATPLELDCTHLPNHLPYPPSSMVDDPSTDAYILWSPYNSGRSFFVPSAAKFAQHVLPRFFKHNRFSSFVRQLNMYGFHKVPHLQTGALVKVTGAVAREKEADRERERERVRVRANGEEEEKEKEKEKEKEGTSSAGQEASEKANNKPPPPSSKAARVEDEAKPGKGGGEEQEEEEVWEFQHPYFQKGRHDLLHLVQRKRSTSKRKSAAASASAAAAKSKSASGSGGGRGGRKAKSGGGGGKGKRRAEDGDEDDDGDSGESDEEDEDEEMEDGSGRNRSSASSRALTMRQASEPWALILRQAGIGVPSDPSNPDASASSSSSSSNPNSNSSTTGAAAQLPPPGTTPPAMQQFWQALFQNPEMLAAAASAAAAAAAAGRGQHQIEGAAPGWQNQNQNQGQGQSQQQQQEANTLAAAAAAAAAAAGAGVGSASSNPFLASESSSSNSNGNNTSQSKDPSSSSAAAGGAAGGGATAAYQINAFWSTLQSIQRAQADLTRDLHHLRTSHSALWQEALESKKRAQQQEQTMGKLLRFLAGVFRGGAPAGGALGGDAAGAGAGGMGAALQDAGLEAIRDLEREGEGDEGGSGARIQEFIDSFSPSSPGAGGSSRGKAGRASVKRQGSGSGRRGDSVQRNVSGETSSAGGSISPSPPAPSSAIQPRRRGLMIEGPAPQQQQQHQSSASSSGASKTPTIDDSGRFLDVTTPDSPAFLSGLAGQRQQKTAQRGSPSLINEQSRFTRIGSPSPSTSGVESNASTPAAQHEEHAASSSALVRGKRNSSSKGEAKKSRRKNDASPAPSSAETPGRRFSQQQQQLINAFSTDQGSAWLAQLFGSGGQQAQQQLQQHLLTGPTGDSSASANGGGLSPMSPNQTALLQSLFSDNEAQQDQQQQQLALTLPRNNLELQKTYEDASKIQTSLQQLVESLRDDPQALATILANQGAIANGINSVEQAPPSPGNNGGAAPSTGGGAGADEDMDALLNQFLHSDPSESFNATPDAAAPSPNAGDAATYAFSPHSTAAHFDSHTSKEAAAASAEDGESWAAEWTPPGSKGGNESARLKTISPESSAAPSPAVPQHGDDETPNKRKANAAGESDSPRATRRTKR